MLYENIDRLVKYGLASGLLKKADAVYARNQLLELMHESDYVEPENSETCCCSGNGESCADYTSGLQQTLGALLDEAVKRGIIQDLISERDVFDAKLMNCLMPRPSEVQKKFAALYEENPQKATDYYYKLSQDSDYIRRYRIVRDKKWVVDSEYGPIDISINLSKPEKDPRAIAAAKKAVSTSYPKCLLCRENEGYAGHSNHPGRSNHRIIPITINGTEWGFQYSPYVYYNEHCIVFNGKHVPMKVERATFAKLFDFIRQFPHYFLGSNADLPIVGGSILSHDHYQGGHYTFAMEKAPVEKEFVIPGYEDVKAGIVKWPLSVIRLQCADSERLIDLATHILEKWRAYSDPDACVFAETDGEPHNTITPIARMKDGEYQLDLALRNNLTSEEYPLGIYHPHPEYHNIKKENIGLIEVMGLAILPSRLEKEMARLEELLVSGGDWENDELTAKHADWVKTFVKDYSQFTAENTAGILQKEIGKTFVHVLENAGVYKNTAEGREAFMRFVSVL